MYRGDLPVLRERLQALEQDLTEAQGEHDGLAAKLAETYRKRGMIRKARAQKMLVVWSLVVVFFVVAGGIALEWGIRKKQAKHEETIAGAELEKERLEAIVATSETKAAALHEHCSTRGPEEKMHREEKHFAKSTPSSSRLR